MPEITDVTPAAPSAATETPNPYASGKLTKELSASWMKGEKTTPHKQESATADTQKQTADSEGKPESGHATEAGKDTQEKGSRRKPGAEERIAELVAENKRLKEAQPKPVEKPAESATAKPEAKVETKLEAPKRPQMKDFDTIEAYDEAFDKYLDARDAYTLAKTREETRREIQQEAAQKEFNTYLDDAAKRYPTLKEVLPPFTKELETVHPYVQEFLNRATENIADVLMVILQDEAAKNEFMTEAKADPAKAIKRITLTEKLVKEELAKGKAKESKETTEEKPEKTPAKTKTSEEPQPTREVGNRGTGPGDPTADAVRRAGGKLTKEVSDAWMRKQAERMHS